MGRYSDINRAAELKAAQDELKKWQDKTRAQKQAAYKAIAKSPAQRVRTERVDAYLLPFGNDSNVIHLRCKALNPTQTGIGAATANMVRGLVDERVKAQIPATAEAVSAPKFQFARVIASERTTTATDDSESRITGIPYKRHRSNNISSPFGRSGPESFADAVKAIKAKTAFGTFIKTVGNRIGFVQEGG